ncbi:toxin-antitoxin system, toxin component [Streptomyces sp. NPDC001985]|uniref:toxin-antitoxin system, toxin component n=1 Tax=Streptomyces sp. NPDC001985 TaxID=3154406 RepID=UPI003326C057
MRRLCARLAGSLRLSVPAEPASVFGALAANLSAQRRREVRIVFRHFPPGTVSGLWSDRGDHDLIVVEESAPPQHQLVITGHEIWHMHAGHRGGHADGAARALVSGAALPDLAGLREMIADTAARSGFGGAEESAAELFGLMLGTELRPLLECRAGSGAPPQGGVAARIHASLGHRAPRGVTRPAEAR